MSIGPSQIKLNLTKVTPTQMTPDSLKAQLDSCGLTCSDADYNNLQGYIDDTRTKLPTGKVQACAIWRPKNKSMAGSYKADDYEEDEAVGNWTVNDAFPCHTQLMYIQYEEHFDYLKDTKPDFCGFRENPPQYGGIEPTVEAVQTQFINAAVAACDVVVEGVDDGDMEAAMSYAIAPLTDDNASDYDQSDSKVMNIVFQYDPTTGYCNGLGILTVEWHLVVKDYQKKSKDDVAHQWTLDIKARSALYGNTDDIYSDYDYVFAKFGESA